MTRSLAILGVLVASLFASSTSQAGFLLSFEDGFSNFGIGDNTVTVQAQRLDSFGDPSLTLTLDALTISRDGTTFFAVDNVTLLNGGSTNFSNDFDVEDVAVVTFVQEDAVLPSDVTAFTIGTVDSPDSVAIIPGSHLVALPEPGAATLLGIFGLGAVVRRRRS